MKRERRDYAVKKRHMTRRRSQDEKKKPREEDVQMQRILESLCNSWKGCKKNAMGAGINPPFSER